MAVVAHMACGCFQLLEVIGSQVLPLLGGLALSMVCKCKGRRLPTRLWAPWGEQPVPMLLVSQAPSSYCLLPGHALLLSVLTAVSDPPPTALPKRDMSALLSSLPRHVHHLHTTFPRDTCTPSPSPRCTSPRHPLPLPSCPQRGPCGLLMAALPLRSGTFLPLLSTSLRRKGRLVPAEPGPGFPSVLCPLSLPPCLRALRSPGVGSSSPPHLPAALSLPHPSPPYLLLAR